MREPTIKELRSLGKWRHTKGLPIEHVAYLVAPSILASIQRRLGHRNNWYFYCYHKGRTAVVRDLHPKPAEILLDFQDNGELLWLHPDEVRVMANDGFDGPWPGPRWTDGL